MLRQHHGRSADQEDDCRGRIRPRKRLLRQRHGRRAAKVAAPSSSTSVGQLMFAGDQIRLGNGSWANVTDVEQLVRRHRGLLRQCYGYRAVVLRQHHGSLCLRPGFDLGKDAAPTQGRRAAHVCGSQGYTPMRNVTDVHVYLRPGFDLGKGLLRQHDGRREVCAPEARAQPW